MTQSVRSTIETLARRNLVLRGRVVRVDNESITIDADGCQYDVLLEHVTNSAQVATAKTGEAVEVSVSPNAQIVEKRLIGPVALPGIARAERIFARRMPRSVAPFDECGRECECINVPECIIIDCITECSYCVGECSYCVGECSYCVSECIYPQGAASRVPRFVRRRR